jgi:hypothetical protein
MYVNKVKDPQIQHNVYEYLTFISNNRSEEIIRPV